MLRVGLAKIRRLRVGDRITLTRGDATRLPVADASVDATTIAFGIRNVDDTRAACAEIHRVLKPGGRLAILEFAIPTGRLIRPLYLWYFRRVLPMIGRVVSRHNAAYGYLPASVAAFATPGEFVTILRQSGFQSISAVPLTFGIVFLYTARARATTDTAIPRGD
jgi:demethylmenaquinone methyltransferase/2-methoxy-6-polyprenyl-1,4-benzoquinol methylase